MSMQSPKGRVSRTNRGVSTVSGVEFNWLHPMVVCRLKVGSAQNRRNIKFWLKKLGLETRCVQVHADGWIESHEVWGSPDGLERFMEMSFVLDGHLPVAIRVPFQGSGAGSALLERHVKTMQQDAARRTPKVRDFVTVEIPCEPEHTDTFPRPKDVVRETIIIS